MKYFLFSSVLFIMGAWTSVAEAHVPNLISPNSELEVITIADPELSQAFYGSLEGFPHTFEINSESPFLLKAEILVPDIDSSQNIFSGIIIKFPEEDGRVTEVARLHANSAEWESKYEPFGGDTYRHGPHYEEEVKAGKYRIEVHTPDNIGKYVLVVGKREEMGVGYFELLGRLIEVKRFFEKTPLLVVQSPYVYVPLIILAILIGVYRRLRPNVFRKNKMV